MGRYRDSLIIFGGGVLIGVIMFAIVASVITTNAGLAVGGTFVATGALLGVTALPTRQRRS
jgi:hypothetical protein